MDFVTDQLSDGRHFNSLTVVDIHTRVSLAIESGQNLRGEDVVRVLNRLKELRSVPQLLFCDNGAELTGQIGFLGISQWRQDRLLPSWEAYRQCLLRIVQRDVPIQMPGHELVPIARRSKAGY